LCVKIEKFYESNMISSIESFLGLYEERYVWLINQKLSLGHRGQNPSRRWGLIMSVTWSHSSFLCRLLLLETSEQTLH
jgi:hypothetical protein